MLNPQAVFTAYKRINKYLHRTPLISSALLNKLSGGHNFYFKLENEQKTAAFKARGAFNKIIKLKEEGNIPKKVSTFSSGNHAQGISYACKVLIFPLPFLWKKQFLP